MLYHNYVHYLKHSNLDDIVRNSFKSNKNYSDVLEHVSFELGVQYANLIDIEFPDIDIDNIKGYISLNDKYGSPNKKTYNIHGVNIDCSSTSIRYIYHALLILNHYKDTTCKNIVEVGCGYGGLCLAIHYFAKWKNIQIDRYHIIDLPEVCNLIDKYTNLHKNEIAMNIQIHDASTYGKDIEDKNLFFVSNYCFTEVDVEHNQSYCSILLPKVSNGFITWQNGGNHHAYPIERAGEIINKKINKIMEEKPQTDAGYGFFKNFFVYF